MGVALVLIVIAAIVAGAGLLLEGLTWLLIIAAAVFVVGALTGAAGRRSSRPDGGRRVMT
jgi:hypothetical protein